MIPEKPASPPRSKPFQRMPVAARAIALSDPWRRPLILEANGQDLDLHDALPVDAVQDSPGGRNPRRRPLQAYVMLKQVQPCRVLHMHGSSAVRPYLAHAHGTSHVVVIDVHAGFRGASFDLGMDPQRPIEGVDIVLGGCLDRGVADSGILLKIELPVVTGADTEHAAPRTHLDESEVVFVR